MLTCAAWGAGDRLAPDLIKKRFGLFPHPKRKGLKTVETPLTAWNLPCVNPVSFFEWGSPLTGASNTLRTCVYARVMCNFKPSGKAFQAYSFAYRRKRMLFEEGEFCPRYSATK